MLCSWTCAGVFISPGVGCKLQLHRCVAADRTLHCESLVVKLGGDFPARPCVVQLCRPARLSEERSQVAAAVSWISQSDTLLCSR